jgi:hypothetical protein
MLPCREDGNANIRTARRWPPKIVFTRMELASEENCLGPRLFFRLRFRYEA